ncbi:Sigma factor regulator N-terminal [Oceanobacillus limi]|uniref:Sigma factor regulator N-terminal n=1 Tax=Oceanobacillus limi TaxID=930131 RepID=A0A1H9Y0K2_9BACI|nr:anti-sigma factor [Oceanobacillus limi]SES62291.1 Sigma factor regulator N-terminal [Oceanobacillus limi]
MTEWNKDLEKRILKKSKFSLTLRILRILVAVLFIYGVYMMVTNIISDKLAIGNENMYYSSLALEWTVPNVRGDFDIKEEDLSAFGTKSLSFDLLKKVGKEDLVIGEAQVTKKLSNRLSNIQYSHPGLQQLSEFSFSLPKDPRSDKKLEANTSPNVWETLEMLPEGTVGELAFSTTDFMEAEQLVKALRSYDLVVLWMPLYTGEFINYDPSGWGGSNNLIMLSDVIGLTGGMDHDENYHQSLRINWLDEGSLEESKQLMIKNIEELLEKPESYYQDFLRLGHLEEKYQYIKDEGFTVYGAVVTGPAKELLKLQDATFVQGEQLGEVELWNWEE